MRVLLATTASLAILVTGCPAIIGLSNDYSAGDGSTDAAARDGTSHEDSPADAGRKDGSTGVDGFAKDSPHDSGSTKDIMAAPDVAPPDACPSSCPVTVTAGWTLIAFNSAGTTACPEGFSQTVVVEPEGSGSCSCGSCDVTAQPDCESGTLSSMWNGGGGSVCDYVGGYFAGNGGACYADALGNATYSAFFASAPVGGSCSSSATPTNATTQQEVMCTPTTGCANDACEPGLGSAFQTCLYQSGVQTCPEASMTKHEVAATDVTSCGACDCNVTASGCSGTMAIYSSSTGCPGTPILTVPADGSCVPMTGVANGDSYIYTANAVGVVCNAGDATATDTLTGQGTICCP